MNVLIKTLNLQEVHTYRKNKWSAFQSCGEYLSCYSNRHRRDTNGRLFASFVFKNIGYLRLPDCVTLLEIIQIFSWGP